MMESTQPLLVLLLFTVAFGSVLAGIPVAFALSGAALMVAFGASVFGLFDLSFLGAIPSRLFGIAIFKKPRGRGLAQ